MVSRQKVTLLNLAARSRGTLFFLESVESILSISTFTGAERRKIINSRRETAVGVHFLKELIFSVHHICSQT
jgi:hypothetical protein